ncbi:uncharacterized protein LOC127092368 isoform X2 [Lathyrus oleraceus]|uniref:uncharacterized protein LOC127092368 isoform X2 n=1 Tax=Pisum sativum TaxID=3888 RepID=UPI0021CF7CCE|nr:uncharacterized protein LOC127092368 isoform X2 [Pisum sativum]
MKKLMKAVVMSKRLRESSSSAGRRLIDNRLICKENFKSIEKDNENIFEQIAFLRNMNRLTIRQVRDANDHFTGENDHRHLSRIKMWLSLSSDDQVQYIATLSRGVIINRGVSMNKGV